MDLCHVKSPETSLKGQGHYREDESGEREKEADVADRI